MFFFCFCYSAFIRLDVGNVVVMAQSSYRMVLNLKYILYQLILFNKVRMLETDIFEIVCVFSCTNSNMFTFLFFLDLRAKMTRLLKTDVVDIHVGERMC